MHSTHGDEFLDPLTEHAAIVSLGATPEGQAALDAARDGLLAAGLEVTLESTEERPLTAFVRRVARGKSKML